MLTKSPSGSLSPYYYMGGELHPLKYGGYHADKAKLFAVMQAEEEYILQSSGQHNRRIWIDLYETRLDGDVIGALVEHICHISGKINKLCLVGCSWLSRRKIQRRLNQSPAWMGNRFRFFSDPEAAKQWLVKDSIQEYALPAAGSPPLLYGRAKRLCRDRHTGAVTMGNCG